MGKCSSNPSIFVNHNKPITPPSYVEHVKPTIVHLDHSSIKSQIDDSPYPPSSIIQPTPVKPQVLYPPSSIIQPTPVKPQVLYPLPTILYDSNPFSHTIFQPTPVKPHVPYLDHPPTKIQLADSLSIPVHQMSLEQVRLYMIIITENYLRYKFGSPSTEDVDFYFEKFKVLTENEIQEIIKLYFQKYGLCKEIIKIWREYFTTYRWNITPRLVEHYAKMRVKYPPPKSKKQIKHERENKSKHVMTRQKEEPTRRSSSPFITGTGHLSISDSFRPFQTPESIPMTNYLDTLSGCQYNPIIDGMKTVAILESYNNFSQ
jgi:hypothetical protein